MILQGYHQTLDWQIKRSFLCFFYCFSLCCIDFLPYRQHKEKGWQHSFIVAAQVSLTAASAGSHPHWEIHHGPVPGNHPKVIVRAMHIRQYMHHAVVYHHTSTCFSGTGREGWGWRVTRYVVH